MRSVQGQESVRLLFRLRTGSSGLLENKERCSRMFSDQRCVICDRSRGGCGSFPGGLWGLFV